MKERSARLVTQAPTGTLRPDSPAVCTDYHLNMNNLSNGRFHNARTHRSPSEGGGGEI